MIATPTPRKAAGARSSRGLRLVLLALLSCSQHASCAWQPLPKDSGAAGSSAQDVQTRLLHWGSTVTDWDSFTSQLRSSVPCAAGGQAAAGGGAPPRVGYFTRHTGTLWDWMAVAEHLGLNWERRNPHRYAKYGMSGVEADELWRRNGSEMCQPSYDVVVYCDTVVDARPALQGGCAAPMVLQATNRFDWKVKDLAAYMQLMNGTAAASSQVWWITNSPYEALYMSWQGLVLPPERHLMLRPVGATVLPAPTLPPDRAGRFAVVIKGNRRKHPDRDVLLPQLRRLGVEGLVEVYDRQYGGAGALAQHRGVLHLPYQVSIMAMYETLAAGGLFIVPSPPFFRTLCQRYRFGQQFVPLFARAKNQGLNWTEYVEWYHPDFGEALVYFRDWEHLVQLLQTPASDEMWRVKRQAALAVMARVREHSLGGWRKVFGALAEAACTSPAAYGAAGSSAQDVQTRLLHWGSTVTDWDSFTSQLRSSVPCAAGAQAAADGGAPPRVGYFTRHTGTLWDWMAVAEHLGLNWERRNPHRYAKYGMSGVEADELWRRNGSEMCQPSYDVVVYCDTVVDARPALQGGCAAPMVLQATNRFDWKVKDLAAYMQLMNGTAAASSQVWWITNSPYEALYMSWQGLVLPPERHLMLRPVGATVLPAPTLPPDRAGRFAVVIKGNRRKHPDRDVLLPQLRRLGVEGLVEVYDRQYGGAGALAQHRGVLHLPYQVSIMAMYETLAAGGLFIVPSPPFFRTLCQRYRFGQQFVPLFARAKNQGLNWTEYVEWYHPDFGEALVYFRDWEHLVQLLQTPASDEMWRVKRQAALAVMARVREHSLGCWRKVFGALAEAACTSPAA
ncbi:hypothetical protein TSOC_012436 [Tetrabaena socialis]|uniref:Uncharacterized protein n=1 Tax=Tetrabaena socialis TaxID=47790 RepID=A0A2J7ZN14_9CHLO|nr:hypothetical protein TSOC_012436 [Tetrabaena socialis]|eukprot:PNH01662.1 hypothetical protein TSOC_012436 [Tetrabaena socialis]